MMENENYVIKNKTNLINTGTLSPAEFDEFTFSKKSHFDLFYSDKNIKNAFSYEINNDIIDLKIYQSLLIYSFLRQNFKTGSKILSIGESHPKMIHLIEKDYQCWCLQNDCSGKGFYKIIKDEIGNFSKELPDDYFDFVFSTSVFGNIHESNLKVTENILKDINRILKPGGYSLHCFNIIKLGPKNFWTNPVFKYFVTKEKIINRIIPFENVESNPDLYVLPQTFYDKYWKSSIGKPYEKFIPFSYNILWEKQAPEIVGKQNSNQINKIESTKIMDKINQIEEKPGLEKFISPDNFEDFTYCKKRHYDLFFKYNYDIELYGVKIDPDYTGMKRYQDLMVYSFIKQNIPKGSKILDIGGGDSRILKRFKDDYECWNIDKLEGAGGGPVKADTTGFRLVKDYMGNFNKELPDNYFDLVMSISTLEHVPQNDKKVHENILKDINRVLKPGGYSLQLIDILLYTAEKNWVHPILPYFFKNEKVINKFIPFAEVFNDPQLYKVSEKFYKDRWEKLYKKTFEEFGTDVNYSLIWQKPFR